MKKYGFGHAGVSEACGVYCIISMQKCKKNFHYFAATAHSIHKAQAPLTSDHPLNAIFLVFVKIIRQQRHGAASPGKRI